MEVDHLYANQSDGTHKKIFNENQYDERLIFSSSIGGGLYD